MKYRSEDFLIPHKVGYNIVSCSFGDLFQILSPSSSLFGGGGGCGCGVRGAAFLCTTNRGKLLQHKLIHVQCAKQSTRVPVSPVPQYGYSV